MARCGRRGGATAAALVGCCLLLGAGCASGNPASAGHHVTSGAAADRQPTQRVLAARYLAIAHAGNRRLDADFGRLDMRDRNRLAAAQADLRDIAATERLFDRRLLQIDFASQTEQVARVLYRVNQARAWLTAAAAASTSLRQLHSLEPQLTAANGPVEREVKIIRRQLGLPPPSTS
jgi:hypothetical protein